jgi:hypothetical protein
MKKLHKIILIVTVSIALLLSGIALWYINLKSNNSDNETVDELSQIESLEGSELFVWEDLKIYEGGKVLNTTTGEITELEYWGISYQFEDVLLVVVTDWAKANYIYRYNFPNLEPELVFTGAGISTNIMALGDYSTFPTTILINEYSGDECFYYQTLTPYDLNSNELSIESKIEVNYDCGNGHKLVEAYPGYVIVEEFVKDEELFDKKLYPTGKSVGFYKIYFEDGRKERITDR